MGGRRAGSKDLAPRIRGSFKRALMVLDGDREPGSGLTELLVSSLREKPLDTLGAIAKFVPKEIEHDVDFGVKKKTRDELEQALIDNGIDPGQFQDG